MDQVSEIKMTEMLRQLISSAGVSGLRKVEKGGVLKRREFREIVEKWYGRNIPWPLVEPDLILVFEDYGNRRGDGNFIVAVELKFFKQDKNLDKALRQAYKEFGQPLRNLIYGFDAACLWHIFDAKIDEEKIREYTKLIKYTIEKFKLPQSYLATAFPSDKIKVYQPIEYVCNNISSLITHLRNLLENEQSPLDLKEVKEYRNAIKVALRIP